MMLSRSFLLLLVVVVGRSLCGRGCVSPFTKKVNTIVGCQIRVLTGEDVRTVLRTQDVPWEKEGHIYS
jgi:hypothetical protein